jgi:hypothetical protein
MKTASKAKTDPRSVEVKLHLRAAKMDRHGKPRPVVYWNQNGKRREISVNHIPPRKVERLLKIANMPDSARRRWLVSKTPRLKTGGTSPTSVTASIILELEKMRQEVIARRARPRARSPRQRRPPRSAFDAILDQLERADYAGRWSKVKKDERFAPNGKPRGELAGILKPQLLTNIMALQEILADIS